jgi:hypothetical protein
VAPITNSIKLRLVNQFRNLQLDEQICLYKQFERVRDSMAIAGIFYETTAQPRPPIVRLDRNQKRKNLGFKITTGCHSSHIAFRNASLETSHQHALRQRLVVDIQPIQTLEYTDDVLCTYRRRPTNKPLINLFLLDDLLYVFRFIITSNHGGGLGVIHFHRWTSGISCSSYRLT